MIASIIALGFKGFRRVRRTWGYWVRRQILTRSEVGVSLSGRVRIEKDCTFALGRGATLHIHDCYIGRNVHIALADRASMDIAADFIGPYTCLVARDSLVIGSGSKLREMVIIRDGNHDHSVPLTDMKFTSSPIQIGRDVWIGARASVLSGVTVGDSSTIGAASVVTSDVVAGQTVAGVPARPITTGIVPYKRN